MIYNQCRVPFSDPRDGREENPVLSEFR